MRSLRASFVLPFVFAATCAWAQALPPAANQQTNKPQIRVIAKLAPGAPHLPTNTDALRAELISRGLSPALPSTCTGASPLFRQYRSPNPAFYEAGFDRVYVLTFQSSTAPEKLVQALSATGRFEYVETDGVGSAGGREQIVPNDPYFNRQWALRNLGDFPPAHAGKADADIDADEAWEIARGDSSVLVAILDSGCRISHPELAGRFWTNAGEVPANGVDDDGNGFIDDVHGWDFVYRTNDLLDTLGHGTNIAGIIAANPDNGRGYAGVDWHCKIMICKVLTAKNFGYYSWWALAVAYAVDHGAKIINMSLGGKATRACSRMPSNTPTITA